MSTPEVEVFWRPGCPFCQSLRWRMRLRRIEATWRNIWEDPEAAEVVRGHNNGDETVPTVRVGETLLTNPSAKSVQELIRGAAR